MELCSPSQKGNPKFFGKVKLFLNREKIASLGLKLQDVQQAVVDEIIKYPHIDKAYTATTMSSVEFSNGIEELLQNGFHQKRSGDVLVVLSPSVISYSRVGTTHGSGFSQEVVLKSRIIWRVNVQSCYG